MGNTSSQPTPAQTLGHGDFVKDDFASPHGISHFTVDPMEGDTESQMTVGEIKKAKKESRRRKRERDFEAEDEELRRVQLSQDRVEGGAMTEPDAFRREALTPAKKRKKMAREELATEGGLDGKATHAEDVLDSKAMDFKDEGLIARGNPRGVTNSASKRKKKKLAREVKEPERLVAESREGMAIDGAADNGAMGVEHTQSVLELGQEHEMEPTPEPTKRKRKKPKGRPSGLQLTPAEEPEISQEVQEAIRESGQEATQEASAGAEMLEDVVINEPNQSDVALIGTKSQHSRSETSGSFRFKTHARRDAQIAADTASADNTNENANNAMEIDAVRGRGIQEDAGIDAENPDINSAAAQLKKRKLERESARGDLAVERNAADEAMGEVEEAAGMATVKISPTKIRKPKQVRIESTEESMRVAVAVGGDLANNYAGQQGPKKNRKRRRSTFDANLAATQIDVVERVQAETHEAAETAGEPLTQPRKKSKKRKIAELTSAMAAERNDVADDTIANPVGRPGPKNKRKKRKDELASTQDQVAETNDDAQLEEAAESAQGPTPPSDIPDPKILDAPSLSALQNRPAKGAVIEDLASLDRSHLIAPWAASAEHAATVHISRKKSPPRKVFASQEQGEGLADEEPPAEVTDDAVEKARKQRRAVKRRRKAAEAAEAMAKQLEEVNETRSGRSVLRDSGADQEATTRPASPFVTPPLETEQTRPASPPETPTEDTPAKQDSSRTDAHAQRESYKEAAAASGPMPGGYKTGQELGHATRNFEHLRPAHANPTKGPFTDVEKMMVDEIYNYCLQQSGLNEEDWIVKMQNWKDMTTFKLAVQDALPSRTAAAIRKFCKRRYHTCAHGAWKREEDAALRDAYAKNPGKWTEISALVGRTAESCKDRWRQLDVPAEHLTGPWSAEEEDKLVKAIDICLTKMREAGVDGSDEQLYSTLSWQTVASYVGDTRTAKQCWEKFHKLHKKTPRKLKLIARKYQECGPGDLFDMLTEIHTAISDHNLVYEHESTMWAKVALSHPKSRFKSAMRRRCFEDVKNSYKKNVDADGPIPAVAKRLADCLLEQWGRQALLDQRTYRSHMLSDSTIDKDLAVAHVARAVIKADEMQSHKKPERSEKSSQNKMRSGSKHKSAALVDESESEDREEAAEEDEREDEDRREEKPTPNLFRMQSERPRFAAAVDADDDDPITDDDNHTTTRQLLERDIAKASQLQGAISRQRAAHLRYLNHAIAATNQNPSANPDAAMTNLQLELPGVAVDAGLEDGFTVNSYGGELPSRSARLGPTDFAARCRKAGQRQHADIIRGEPISRAGTAS